MEKNDFFNFWINFLEECHEFFEDCRYIIFDHLDKSIFKLESHLNEYYNDSKLPDSGIRREEFLEEKEHLEKLIADAKKIGPITLLPAPEYNDEAIETYTAVYYKAEDHDIILRWLGVYDSYQGLTHFYQDGGDSNNWVDDTIGDWKIVEPVERTITVYK